LEHNLTHWYGTTTEKILSWREFRKSLEFANPMDSIESIANWWTYAPWVKKTIDPYKPETWPTPWAMITLGHFCRSAIALGQAYTIWSIFPDVDCEIWLINNRSEQDVHLITVVNKSIMLNYTMTTLVPVENGDFELLQVVHREDLTHIKL
jgi:hypothetical protein